MRPREKAMRYGLSSLSNQELLALFIRTGTAQHNAIELAQKLLLRLGGLKGLAKARIEDLMEIPGIKEAKALNLMAVVELAMRLLREEVLEQKIFNHPRKISDWLNLEIGFSSQEEFMVLFLDHRLQLLRFKKMFKGTLNQSLVHPRDVFREAAHSNAAALVLVHNHPGGSLEPSHADIEMTQHFVEAGKFLEIQVIDHLIVSKGAYCSIREKFPELFN